MSLAISRTCWWVRRSMSMPWSMTSTRSSPRRKCAQLRGLSHGLVPLPQAQARLHGARGAAREHDETLVELAEQLLVGAGPLAELAVRRGVGPQAEEVVHAGRVVRDQGQVVVGAAGAHIVGALPRLAHRTFWRSKRDVPGVTYASRPMIGLTPAFLQFV